ncbi:hypothetical protein ACYCFC_02040 [Stutzerimonas sp. NM35]
MTYEQIRVAIIARMASFQGLSQDRIDYPNQPGVFEPPEAGLWCRINLQYGRSFIAGMADVPCTRRPGQIVIQCFDRKDAGIKGLTKLTDDLCEQFEYWRTGNLECWEVSQVDVGVGDRAGNAAGTGFYQINIVIRFTAG